VVASVRLGQQLVDGLPRVLRYCDPAAGQRARLAYRRGGVPVVAVFDAPTVKVAVGVLVIVGAVAWTVSVAGSLVTSATALSTTARNRWPVR
jgi:uncharacterized membrane protein YphA (DoxX/SURF4 family)